MIRRRVLVVDDSEIVLEAASAALSEFGFEVQTTMNPMAVSFQLREFEPNVILLDVDMPAVQGPEVVEVLRRHAMLKDTHVILYSARPLAELKDLAKACGAVASISKNVIGKELASAVANHLRSRLGQAEAPPLLASKTALVAVRESESEFEAGLRDRLAKLGMTSRRTGPLGLDRALRADPVDLLVLDGQAFAPPLLAILERLHVRRLLKGTAVITLTDDDVPGATSVSRSQAGTQVFRLVVLKALGK
ncbi:response regulator [Planctomycetota bacterium]|nr:response regulator [Planctomycetota bacterium]